jgi:hypothetical protein
MQQDKLHFGDFSCQAGMPVPPLPCGTIGNLGVIGKIRSFAD